MPYELGRGEREYTRFCRLIILFIMVLLGFLLFFYFYIYFLISFLQIALCHQYEVQWLLHQLTQLTADESEVGLIIRFGPRFEGPFGLANACRAMFFFG